MSTTNTPVRHRFVIPVSEELQTEVLDILSGKRIKVAELGRKLFEDYVRSERKRIRHEELKKACEEYADIVAEIQHEWRHTEVEGWPDE